MKLSIGAPTEMLRMGRFGGDSKGRRLVLVGCLLGAFAFGQTSTDVAGKPGLAVSGDVGNKLTLTTDDLAKMLRETVSIAEHDGAKANYEGVALREILQRAGAPLGKQLRGKALASYILARAHDGYQVLFSLGEVDTMLGNESIIVADKRNGEPLPGNLGRLRLICPKDEHAARSVRMLESIELVRLQK
jgi:DMSO/TMAO reductase YedYZ molybdopterin-dependent catalytic subunit